MVDRVCVQMEECSIEGQATLAVRAVVYGSLKLKLGPHTQALPRLLSGSRVEFSCYLDVEKDIKNCAPCGCPKARAGLCMKATSMVRASR